MKTPKPTTNMIRYIGLGIQWAVLLLLAVWGGIRLDEKIKWRFPIGAVLLPLIALIFSLWKIIKEFSKPKP